MIRLPFIRQAVMSRSAETDWTPLELASLAGWYRADNVTLDEEATPGVETWPDLSGNENHLGQVTTSARPTVAADFNGSGEPYLSFDGINDHLERASFALGGAELVVHVIGRVRFKSNGKRIVTYDQGGLSYPRIQQSSAGFSWWGPSAYPQSTVVNASSDFIDPGNLTLEYTASSGTRIFAGFNLVDADPGDPTAVTDGNPLTVAATSTGGNPSQLDLAELIILNASVSSEDLDLLQQYTTRYGFPAPTPEA